MIVNLLPLFNNLNINNPPTWWDTFPTLPSYNVMVKFIKECQSNGFTSTPILCNVNSGIIFNFQQWYRDYIFSPSTFWKIDGRVDLGYNIKDIKENLSIGTKIEKKIKYKKVNESGIDGVFYLFI